MKIVIDAYGGDNAPFNVAYAVNKASKIYKDVEFIVVGKKNELKKICAGENIKIVNAEQIIENDETPTTAIREKKDSSLVVAFDILKNDADALISCGSTGAILVGGFTKIGRLKGISRPCLCPLLPTKNGKKVMLLDVGANMDCKAVNLLHFAIMGSIYMKSCENIQKPKVALLNVGTEEKKGNELTKEAFDLLEKEKELSFVGNMEAREIMSGDYDVVVCDGFSGNIALKSIEGAVLFSTSETKKAFNGFAGKIAGLFVLKNLKKIKSRLDYTKYGGSSFLGLKKIIIKSHGSSNEQTIMASIEQAIHLIKSNYISSIENVLKLSENNYD